MGKYLDSVPFSGIIRIRDMMYGVKDPFRLDQGDVSFDAPDSVKEAMRRAIAENHSHYLQTTGVPRLLELLAEKLRRRNRLPVGSAEELMVTNGGIHGVYICCQALLEPGDEVIVPDPLWPPGAASVLAAQAVPVGCPLHESLDWRWDLDELEARITRRTRMIYLNSPNNPSGGVLTRSDLERIAEIARTRDLWVLSDEAYEDVVFDGTEQLSIGSLPGMYSRTVPIYTFSKTYAMTGLRLGYLAVENGQARERMKKVLFYTTGNVASVVQYGGIGALEGSQAIIDWYRDELRARRDLFYQGLQELEGGVFSGRPPRGAFYAFPKINPDWGGEIPAGAGAGPQVESISWRMTEYLISRARIGCVPGVDFGPQGEGYIRFCFAREPSELRGALESMKALFGVKV
jgi:aspartate aminotransferase